MLMKASLNWSVAPCLTSGAFWSKTFKHPHFFLLTGQPAPHHEEGRHSNTQQKSVQQEQEEQEGRHVGVILGGEPATLYGRQLWALFPWPRDSADLQPHTAPHPNTVATATARLRQLTLHTPPQHWYGAHTGVKKKRKKNRQPLLQGDKVLTKQCFIYSGISTLACLPVICVDLYICVSALNFMWIKFSVYFHCILRGKPQFCRYFDPEFDLSQMKPLYSGCHICKHTDWELSQL